MHTAQGAAACGTQKHVLVMQCRASLIGISGASQHIFQFGKATLIKARGEIGENNMQAERLYCFCCKHSNNEGGWGCVPQLPPTLQSFNCQHTQTASTKHKMSQSSHVQKYYWQMWQILLAAPIQCSIFCEWCTIRISVLRSWIYKGCSAPPHGSSGS
jgi:hypothetical protein